MLIQQALICSNIETAGRVYACPQLIHYGSVSQFTSAGSGVNPKTGNAVEGNPGGGGGDQWRP